eukprot:scaffold77552_cov63-Phaeocystis_antarctica.AAC.4
MRTKRRRATCAAAAHLPHRAHQPEQPQQAQREDVADDARVVGRARHQGEGRHHQRDQRHERVEAVLVRGPVVGPTEGAQLAHHLEAEGRREAELEAAPAQAALAAGRHRQLLSDHRRRVEREQPVDQPVEPARAHRAGNGACRARRGERGAEAREQPGAAHPAEGDLQGVADGGKLVSVDDAVAGSVEHREHQARLLAADMSDLVEVELAEDVEDGLAREDAAPLVVEQHEGALQRTLAHCGPPACRGSQHVGVALVHDGEHLVRVGVGVGVRVR